MLCYVSTNVCHQIINAQIVIFLHVSSSHIVRILQNALLDRGSLQTIPYISLLSRMLLLHVEYNSFKSCENPSYFAVQESLLRWQRAFVYFCNSLVLSICY